MEFKIEKKEFLTGLEKTLSVVERRNTMPSLNHALIDLKEDHMQISATDLEIFVSATLKCQIVEQGRLAVPAKSLYDIVRECPDKGEIHFKLVDSHRLEIKAGRSKFKLLGLAPDSFPHFKTSPKGQLSTGTLKSKEFLKLLSHTEHCICTEEYRYALTGIYMESVDIDGKNYTRTVATDGHRLAMMELNDDELGKIKFDKGLIIPKKGATELRKLLESTDEETFEVVCDENLLRASVGNFKLWIRPIDSEYPDYRRVIPKELPSSLFIKSKELNAGLKRMSLLVSDRSRVVTFDFQKDHVKLSTQNPDLGEATDEVPGEYNGGELKTGFNVRFFMDAISNFSGETIEIKVGEKLQPAVLTSKDDKGFLIVIMPMRL